VLPGEAHFDEGFNEQQFREVLKKEYDVLHLVTHFVFKPHSETDSFLLLGDGKRLSLRDLRENYTFASVDLITISAPASEGFPTLVQTRGAKSLIITLWQVADSSRGILMQNFYRIRESRNMTKVEALRETQLKFMSRCQMVCKKG
jgi:CHAT domain-containing protein